MKVYFLNFTASLPVLDVCERGPVWTVTAEATEGENSKDIQV